MEGGVFRHSTSIYNEINDNLAFLTENLTNLYMILIRLREKRIISEHEFELINSENTNLTKNNQLLSLIQKKNWHEIKTFFLQILRDTGNEHCAERIKYNVVPTFKKSAMWWPEEKTLPKAFHERKSDNCLLTEQLQQMLSKNVSDEVAVITQKVTISGLGGIGKTTTAIWYAQQYQGEYDHIVWIDCGEKSLLNSFKNLAVDLDIKNRAEKNHDVKLLAVSAFQILKEQKCLFVFDNAECYIGNEGIKKVLPKSNKNFDVLITSRKKDWGFVNGDGKIPQFQMDVFNQSESVELMKKNIAVLPENADSQLQLLCDLLGNLPLAIQIAVATLNEQNIVNLQSYIDKIKNTPEILLETIDTYETTIDKTMKISLYLIQNHESNDERRIGEISCKILSIFGFITPDHVPATFFRAVETKKLKLFERINSTLFNFEYQTEIYKQIEIEEAVRLLERYSLITRNHPFADNQTLSIHRLLQQVMRHNFKSSEEQIITQILNCDGFLEYKLIPFNYANEKLQNKFPKIKAELIDKLELKQLISERRFHEAVVLSRIIKHTLKTPVPNYNFAICLKQNNELTECENELESLLKQIGAHESKSALGRYSSNLEVVESDTKITECMLREQLFLIYFQQQNVTKASNFLLKWKSVTLPIPSLNELMDFIWLLSISNLFLEHHEMSNRITLRIGNLNQQTMSLKLHFRACDKIFDVVQNKFLTLTDITLEYCSVDFSIVSPSLKKLTLNDCFLINCLKSNSVKDESQANRLEELSLINIFVKERKDEGQFVPFEISQLISPNLRKLCVTACKCADLRILLYRLISIQTLYLEGCALVYDPNIRIAPSELTLKNVFIIDRYQTALNHITVNSFVNLTETNYLSVTGLSIDFNESIKIKELILINVDVVNWKHSKWVVEKLFIFPSAGPTHMNINQKVILKELTDYDLHETKQKENCEGTLTTQMDSKKQSVLSYLRQIANSSTISGLYLSAFFEHSNEWVRGFRTISGVSPGIISIQMPKLTSNETEWTSFTTQVISNWNNHHFVRINWWSENLFSTKHFPYEVKTMWKNMIKDEYEGWKQALDKIALYLHKIQNAGVVAILDILPLINATSQVWGGNRGVDGSVKLYKITHAYLTKQHNLTSLIWTWSLDAYHESEEFEKYWPGSEYADVVSVYMTSKKELTMSEYERLINLVGEKPLSMENVNIVPNIELLTAQPRWIWFTAHYYHLEETHFNNINNVKTTFNSNSVIHHGNIDFFN